MAYYQRVGNVPTKRHTHHIDESGHRYSEELMGQHGFSSNSSLLYHRHSPSALTAIEAIEVDPGLGEGPGTPDHPVTPRHIRTRMIPSSGDAVTGRCPVLINDDVEVSWVEAERDSDLYRNAIGDELAYVQAGSGRLDSVFGHLDVRAGDYVVVPASTTHRWAVTSGPLQLLVISSRGHVAPPRHHLSHNGQFLEHAPYCERDLRGPHGLIDETGNNVPVLVRSRGGWSRHVHRDHPFDVVRGLQGKSTTGNPLVAQPNQLRDCLVRRGSGIRPNGVDQTTAELLGNQHGRKTLRNNLFTSLSRITQSPQNRSADTTPVEHLGIGLTRQTFVTGI